MDQQNVMSAQVVVKKSAKQDIAAVMEGFRAAGFSTGAAVANNFSITGPASLFRSKSLQASEAGGADIENESAAYVLSSVNPGVRALVEAVVFPKPPEFGPGADV